MWLRTLTYCFKIRCCWEMKRERARWNELVWCWCWCWRNSLHFWTKNPLVHVTQTTENHTLQNSLPNWKWTMTIVFSVVLMCLCNRECYEKVRTKPFICCINFMLLHKNRAIFWVRPVLPFELVWMLKIGGFLHTRTHTHINNWNKQENCEAKHTRNRHADININEIWKCRYKNESLHHLRRLYIFFYR